MDIEEVLSLRSQAIRLQLQKYDLVLHYSPKELMAICNGIGAQSFPQILRELLDALHPTLRPVAYIHDIQWYESDQTKESFTESNERFKRNGYKAAKAKYSWYNPKRYIVMNQARRFGNICQAFGWDAWLAGAEQRKKRQGVIK